MSASAAFTAEEWKVVAHAPLLAAARVVAAERGGTIRENLAIRRVYSAARELHGESGLLDALVASSPSLELRGGDPGPEVHARVAAAVAVVEAKTGPDDVEAYKGFVLAVVQTVAEANREGGFAGIGGEEVSEREQAALDELTAVLEQ
jgi:hypothetical protein